MALGGGPPVLSLLTGVAQGIQAGEERKRQAQREAVLDRLRQLQVEQAQQNIELARQQEERLQETLHETQRARASKQMDEIQSRGDRLRVEADRIQQMNPDMSRGEAMIEARGIVAGAPRREDPAEQELERRQKEASIASSEAAAASSRQLSSMRAEAQREEQRTQTATRIAQNPWMGQVLPSLKTRAQVDQFISDPATIEAMTQQGLEDVTPADVYEAWTMARTAQDAQPGQAEVAGAATAQRLIAQHGSASQALTNWATEIEQLVANGEYAPTDLAKWQAILEVLEKQAAEERRRVRPTGGSTESDKLTARLDSIRAANAGG